MDNIDFQKSIFELKKNIAMEVLFLEELIVRGEKDLAELEEHISEADVVLLYKSGLGLGIARSRLLN